jgi:hypothetical protein
MPVVGSRPDSQFFNFVLGSYKVGLFDSRVQPRGALAPQRRPRSWAMTPTLKVGVIARVLYSVTDSTVWSMADTAVGS